MENEKQDAEIQLLQHLNAHECIPDTWAYALDMSISHALVVGVVKSLLVDAFVTATDISTSFVVLSDEAQDFILNGSPEYRLVQHVHPETGTSREACASLLGSLDLMKVAQGAAMKNKWIQLNKETGKLHRVTTEVAVRDTVVDQLKTLEADPGGLSADQMKQLKRRKLITPQYVITSCSHVAAQ